MSGKTLVKPAEMVLPSTSRSTSSSVPRRDPLLLRPGVPVQAGRDPRPEQQVHLHATQLGTFQGQCAEFCGLCHSKMTFALSRVDVRLSGLGQAAAEGRPAASRRAPKGTTLRSSATTSPGTRPASRCPGTRRSTVTVTNLDAGSTTTSRSTTAPIGTAVLPDREVHRVRDRGRSTSMASAPGQLLLPVRRARPGHVRRVHRESRSVRRRKEVTRHGGDRGPDQTLARTRARRSLGWLTTTDHKKIGILYLINSFAFFVIGGVFALLMRTSWPARDAVLRPARLQPAVHRARDDHDLPVRLPGAGRVRELLRPPADRRPGHGVPRINALSFWLLPVGGLTILSGFLAKGGAAAAGWTNYAPLSVQGGTGEDLWILGLLIVGTASILGGDQLHRHDPAAPGPGDDHDAAAHLRAGRHGHLAPGDPGHPGVHLGPDHAPRRPATGDGVLRSHAGRQRRCCGRTCSGSSATRRSTC